MLKLNLNEIMCNYQVAEDEGWQGCGETAARLIEQVPVLVAELRAVREAIHEEEDEVAQAIDEAMQAWAEAKRLRALVPDAGLLRELSALAVRALPITAGGPSATDAIALARRIEEDAGQ